MCKYHIIIIKLSLLLLKGKQIYLELAGASSYPEGSRLETDNRTRIKIKELVASYIYHEF